MELKVKHITDKPSKHFGKVGADHSERRLRKLYQIIWGVPVIAMNLDTFGALAVDYSGDSSEEEQARQHKKYHKLAKMLDGDQEDFREAQASLMDETADRMPPDYDEPIRLKCGAIACIGGWAAINPSMNREGLALLPNSGQPYIYKKSRYDGRLVEGGNLQAFFLHGLRQSRMMSTAYRISIDDIFTGRGSCDIDHVWSTTDSTIHDKYLALRRIRFALYATRLITKERSRELFEKEKKLAIKSDRIPKHVVKQWGDIPYDRNKLDEDDEGNEGEI